MTPEIIYISRFAIYRGMTEFYSSVVFSLSSSISMVNKCSVCSLAFILKSILYSISPSCRFCLWYYLVSIHFKSCAINIIVVFFSTVASHIRPYKQHTNPVDRGKSALRRADMWLWKRVVHQGREQPVNHPGWGSRWHPLHYLSDSSIILQVCSIWFLPLRPSKRRNYFIQW